MVAIPLLSGTRGTEQAEFVAVPPLNLEPVAIDTNLSKGQLRAAIGAVQVGTGPGVDRGGIVWNDVLYRVMGTKLCRMDGATYTVIGDVGGSGPVRMDYSHDRLGLASDNKLWFYDGTTLQAVTDPDIGIVRDVIWIDGYWMTTDGTYILVTELSDPLEVKTLKYGSAEEDPDAVVSLIKTRNEAHVLGRHTIQVFRNVGGSGFPFATVRGATTPYGCVGVSAKVTFADSYAFVGSARNEALAVFLAGQANATRISDRAVEDALAAEVDPQSIVLEVRTYRDEQRLVMHLANESWCFLANGTSRAQAPLWYRLKSGAGAYRPRHAVLLNGTYHVGDAGTAAFGTLSEAVSSHFDEAAPWEFQAGYLYNEGLGGIVRSLELVGLPGRIAAEDKATAFMSLTKDGTNWTQERAINMGRAGESAKRLQWRPRARFSNYVGFRFRGLNRAMPGFSRLEARIDGLGR